MEGFKERIPTSLIHPYMVISLSLSGKLRFFALFKLRPAHQPNPRQIINRNELLDCRQLARFHCLR